MARVRVLLALVVSLLAVAVPVTVLAQIDKMDAELASIDKVLGKIESSKAIAKSDAVLDRHFDAYAKAALNAFKDARSATESDARAKKDSGGLAKLKAFEDKAKAHRGDMDKVVERISEINAGVTRGDIRIQDDLLRELTPQQKTQFKKTLTPEAAQKYGFILEMDDARLASSVGDADDAADAYSRVKAQEAEQRICPGTARRLLSAAHEVMFPRAEAALGIGCYGVCAASLGLGCVACVVSAGGAAVTAYNQFASAMSHCCTCHWYKPWCCGCKAAAVVAFLAALA